MITTHQYLDKYPISKNTEKLIVGTIHPHNHDQFEFPFFYGNVGSLWKILSDAFPDELFPLSMDKIIEFLERRKIAMSDTILVCERKTKSAFDNDLIPLKLNYQILEDIRNSNVKEIFFTSSFGKNNAFKLFYVDILKQKITPEIKLNREVDLDPSFFGKKVKLKILLSPSGASNIAVAKSSLYLEKKADYAHSKRPVYDFKVAYYRAIFERF